MLKKKIAFCFVILMLVGVICSHVHAEAEGDLVVKKDERTTIVSTDYGHVSAARITDGANASYLIHTFTLHPNSMFLPVILNSNMLFYVQSGSGRLSWADEDKIRQTDLEEGDVFRLLHGTVFFINCYSYSKSSIVQQPLQINAIFANSDYDLREPDTGAYSSIQELVLGVDRKALQATFKVSVEVIDQMLGGPKPPAIIRVDDPTPQIPKGFKKSTSFNVLQSLNNIKKVNVLRKDKDFENCYGWVTTLPKKKALKDSSNIGFFMVNLKPGSMMEPNWNSMSTEVVVVLKGRGMVRVVCSKLPQGRVCRNARFEVGEGDVFVVPRFHEKAQMAFNDGPLVLMGFSSVQPDGQQPQFLGGKYSVLRALGSGVVAKTFNVANATVAQLLAPKDESVIFACRSCAEEELKIMTEDREKEQGGGGTGGEPESEGEEEEEELDGGLEEILKF